MKERLLLVLTVLGFVVPNVCLGIFFANEGFDISGYFSLWTASTPSTQLLLDLTIAALAFFVWAAVEGPRAKIKWWWVCLPGDVSGRPLLRPPPVLADAGASAG